MSEVLHASFKEQCLLLSISRDPSSPQKINKFLCTVLLKKNYKGKRRERLPAQRGEACNSTGVLTRFVGSEAMLLLLHDSVGALSRSPGSRATPEMKTYTLKIFNS